MDGQALREAVARTAAPWAREDFPSGNEEFFPSSSRLALFTVTLEQLETLNEHGGRSRLSHLGIKHCVV